jgi:hypothetical protein
MDKEEIVRKQVGKIRRRFYRRTIRFPDGSVVHHGDCEIYNVDICTCGLLHDLRILFEHDNELREVYDLKVYWEEQVLHDRALEEVCDIMEGRKNGKKEDEGEGQEETEKA